MSGVLTNDDYEKKRIFSDYDQWIKENCSDLKARGGFFGYEKHIADPATRRLVKKFYEEALPLRHFLTLFDCEKIENCQLFSGNQAYDAKVYLKGKDDPVYFELGAGFDGQSEALLKENLSENKPSFAPLLGKYGVGEGVTKASGSTREISAPLLVQDLSFSRNCVISNLRKIAEKKATNKGYDEYPICIVLLFRWPVLTWDQDDVEDFSNFYDNHIEPLNNQGKQFFLMEYNPSQSSSKKLFFSDRFQWPLKDKAA